MMRNTVNCQWLFFGLIAGGSPARLKAAAPLGAWTDHGIQNASSPLEIRKSKPRRQWRRSRSSCRCRRTAPCSSFRHRRSHSCFRSKRFIDVRGYAVRNSLCFLNLPNVRPPHASSVPGFDYSTHCFSMINSRVRADIPTSKLLEFSRDLDLPSEAFDMVLHDGKLKVRPFALNQPIACVLDMHDL
jgi:hypothetical protein